MSDLQINEICRAYVLGISVMTISEAEQLPIDEVNSIITGNEELINQLRVFYKTMKEG